MMQRVFAGLGMALWLATALAACAVEVDDEREPVAEQGQDLKAKHVCGLGAAPCPEGYACIDDPTDDCDATQGDVGCRVCRRAEQGKKHCEHGPGVHYVARDPSACSALRMHCPEGVPFFDDCGCGCKELPGEPCGSEICGAGEYCCNPSCGWCAPVDVYCLQVACG